MSMISKRFRSVALRIMPNHHHSISTRKQLIPVYNGDVKKAAEEEPVKYLAKDEYYNKIWKFGEYLNHWVKLPNTELNKINDISDTLYHNFTLLDDLLDGSDQRKNRPAAHVVFGSALTLIGSLLGTSLALTKIEELYPQKGAKNFNRYVQEWYRAAGMEIYWRHNFVCPEEHEYIQNTILKCSGFLHFTANLLQHCGQTEKDLSKLINLISLFYGIGNDFSDYVMNDLSEGKHFCDDLTEGKFNFPMIHAVKTANNQEIFEILFKKTKDIELKNNFVNILKGTGSFQYTLDFLSFTADEINHEIHFHGGNPKLKYEIDNTLSNLIKCSQSLL